MSLDIEMHDVVSLDIEISPVVVYPDRMSKQAVAVVSCRRDELADVKQLAAELGRRQNRSVPQWEVLRMLIAYYRRGMAIEAASAASSRPTSANGDS